MNFLEKIFRIERIIWQWLGDAKVLSNHEYWKKKTTKIKAKGPQYTIISKFLWYRILMSACGPTVSELSITKEKLSFHILSKRIQIENSVGNFPTVKLPDSKNILLSYISFSLWVFRFWYGEFSNLSFLFIRPPFVMNTIFSAALTYLMLRTMDCETFKNACWAKVQPFQVQTPKKSALGAALKSVQKAKTLNLKNDAINYHLRSCSHTMCWL